MFFTLFLLPALTAAYVYQSSEVGETATVSFDVTAAGSSQECGTIITSGSTSGLTSSIYFTPVPSSQYSDNFASDMFITVTMDSGAKTCLQFGGYDFVSATCGEGGKFPSRWESNKAGNYSSTDTITALTDTSFTVCIGNGYEGSDTAGYRGTVTITGLTTTELAPTPAPSPKPSSAPSVSNGPTLRPVTAAPSKAPTRKPSGAPSTTFSPTKDPITITSECDATVAVSYDVVLSGAQKVCQYIPADGGLDSLFVSLTFGGGTTVEYAGDMAAVVYSSDLKKGVQVGGYDYFVDGISYVGPWPEDWQTTAAGTYTATINDLATYGIAGNGYYYFCLLNGWKYAAKTKYSGTGSLNGLTSDCSLVPPSPTSKPSVAPSVSFKPTVAQITDTTVNAGTLSLDFDFSAIGQQQYCKTVYASGAITAVQGSFTFTPTQSDSYAQDLYITVQSDHASSCIQVGGYDVSKCATSSSFPWPSTFDKSTAGIYTATVAVSSPDYENSGYAPYTVCYGNGYTASKSVTYSAGTSSFTGLTENYNRQYVTQTSPVGQTAEVVFDVVEAGSGQVCGTIGGATGTVKYLNTSLYFNPMSSDPYVDNYASDLYITVSALDASKNVVKCVQYGGYDYVAPGCSKSGIWPSNFEVNTAGNYAYNGYVREAAVSGSNSWTVCVGNGYKSSEQVTYEGSVLLTGLSTTAVFVTSAPTRVPTVAPTTSKKPSTKPTTPLPSLYPTRKPSVAPTRTFKPTADALIITSQTGTTLAFSYDAVLAGKDRVCTYFGANGATLSAISATLNFPGADTVEYPGDMGIVVYSPDLGYGVQVGGYDYYIPSVNYVSPWPASWQTTEAGTYTATIDVTSYDITGTGFYYLCIFNGWQYAAKIEYQGTGSLPGLIYDSALVPPAPTGKPTVAPTITYAPTQAAVSDISAVGGTLDVRFDVTLSGSQQKCVTVGATGSVSSINASYSFAPTGTDSYASDLYITIKSDQVATCLQLGGYNVKMCGSATTNYYSWPSSFSTTKAGSYKALVSIANTLYANTLAGAYEVCYGNGYTSGAAATFKGHSSFPPLKSVEIYPEAACGAALAISFDTVLAGKTAACADLGAAGSFTTVEMTLQFGGSSGSEWASDMGLAVFNNLSATGVQVGGDDYIIPNTQKGGSWPASWDTAAAGTYTATVDVSALKYGGTGNYRVCVVNGLLQGSSVSYAGTANLKALTRKCGAPYSSKPSAAPTPVPTVADAVEDTSTKSGVLATSFNLNLEGAEQSCIDVVASGTINEVAASFVFTPSPADPNFESYASDFYVTVSAPMAASCIQVGGYDVILCADTYSWPKTFETTAPNLYTAHVPVSNDDFAKLGSTTYTLCYGNGLLTSSVVQYQGTSEIAGLTDSSVKTSSDSNNKNNKTVLLAVAIPLVILLAAAVGVYWYFYCRNKPSSGGKANLSSPYAAYDDSEAVVPRTNNSSSQGSTINNPLLQNQKG